MKTEGKHKESVVLVIDDTCILDFMNEEKSVFDLRFYPEAARPLRGSKAIASEC